MGFFYVFSGKSNNKTVLGGLYRKILFISNEGNKESKAKLTMSDKPIIGQEAVCPDGLGRVVALGLFGVYIDTYIDNRCCDWALHNVELIDPKHGIKGSSVLTKIVSDLTRLKKLRNNLSADDILKYQNLTGKISQCRSHIDLFKGK